MTTEEKALAYDEALQRAKHALDCDKNGLINTDKILIESMFPELKESEDEKIRKAIIEHFKYNIEEMKQSGSDDYEAEIEEQSKYIAWLEKQGEHQKFRDCIQVGDEVTRNDAGILVNLSQLRRVAKPRKQGEQNPIKPNFKIGDWITFYGGEAFEILKIEEEQNGILDYLLRRQYGDDSYYNKKYVDENARFWTIQDANDGDVLAWDNSKCIALFKNIYDKESFKSHVSVGHCTGTFELREAFHDIEGAHPATKEQRDLLFQKMEEAGYKWDAEKKELKKIEQKPAEWSKEDKKKLEEAICMIESNGNWVRSEDAIKSVSNWLKSLRPKNCCEYNPYKVTVESISKMAEKYESSNSDLQDFYDNVKVKCRDAKEYDKEFSKIKAMKVFGCKRQDCYSGGLILVAAETKEQAFLTAAMDETLHKLFKWRNENGKPDGNISHVYSGDYPLAYWEEVNTLYTKLDTPQVIIEAGYTE